MSFTNTTEPSELTSCTCAQLTSLTHALTAGHRQALGTEESVRRLRHHASQLGDDVLSHCRTGLPREKCFQLVACTYQQASSGVLVSG